MFKNVKFNSLSKRSALPDSNNISLSYIYKAWGAVGSKLVVAFLKPEKINSKNLRRAMQFIELTYGT
jgi:hypothetical protein